jgi:hypothetical protein
MQVSLEPTQIDLLVEILTTTVNQLRIESSRTDGHAFRDLLHERERMVESILAKLATEARSPAS